MVSRRLGWDADPYTEWTVRTMKDGTAIVTPRTTVADIDIIIDALG